MRIAMLKSWLRDALKKTGISQAELSRKLTARLGRSIDHAAVNKMVSGKRKIAGDELMVIAELTGVKPPRFDGEVSLVEGGRIGLPLRGKVAAGSWLEVSVIQEAGEEEILPVPHDMRFPRATQYVLEVQGDSMNLEFPHGTFVTCVDFYESGIELKPGHIAHVERYRFDGQEVEVTLKAVELVGGRFLLVPRSTNPAHKPFPADGDDATTVVIKGIVTGSWRKTPI
jgi:SOS-response transcriptional repressor LexA